MGVEALKRASNGHFLEQRDAENLWDLVEIHLQPQTLADDGNQHINRDGDPDLSLHCVVAGPIKRFDPQVLLDPFVEQFHLPRHL